MRTLAPTSLLFSLCCAAGCTQMPATLDASESSVGLDATLTETGADDASPQDASLDVPGRDVLRPPPINRTMTEAQLAPMRRGCGFNAGAWPAQTLGTEYPVGTDIPINHVIVIVQENRSFDHYLGRLVAQGYYQPGDFRTTPDGGVGSGYAHPEQLDGPPPGWTVPDSDGTPIAPRPDNEHCYGVNHGWNDMHEDWNNGRNDGFVRNNNPNGQRAMFYEDDTVIPFYYALANTFAVADHYHASVLTSTWPNRLYTMAATSFGLGDNSFVTSDTSEHPANNIFLSLEAGGYTWRDYTDGPHQVQFFLGFGFRTRTLANLRNMRCDLYNDIRNGTLPNVAYVMGDEVGGTTDEGPSALAGVGGQLVENVLRELFASPSWRDTAVFITYDENGGLADHVPPPPACPPDNLPPRDGMDRPLPGDFARLGFRVPFLLVSPYARRHFASHLTYDHTSILRFIEARFGLPALTNRDANATPPMEMFDFQNPPFMTAPTIAAHTVVPQAVLDRCGQHYGPWGCGTSGDR